jgi:P27 family predicted phage terminase small subunit
MTRGPHPTPSAVKRLRGTYRRDRARGEPAALPGTPQAPNWLNADARAEWRRIAPLLRSRGLLEVLDRPTLVGYCTCWADLIDAERRLAEEGSTVIGARGQLYLNPQLRRAQKAREQLIRYGMEFGLSPSARTRVQASPPPPPENAERAAAALRFFGT